MFYKSDQFHSMGSEVVNKEGFFFFSFLIKTAFSCFLVLQSPERFYIPIRKPREWTLQSTLDYSWATWIVSISCRRGGSPSNYTVRAVREMGFPFSFLPSPLAARGKEEERAEQRETHFPLNWWRRGCISISKQNNIGRIIQSPNNWNC